MANQDRNQIEQNQGKSEENINTKDFLIGALIGGIIGATTALFLAPKSGKELRSDINEQAIVLKEKTDQLRETAKTKGTELAAVAKDKTNALTQTVSKQSTEIVNKVKSLRTGAHSEDQVEEIESEEVVSVANEDDIQKKLEETKRAFDETEVIYNR